jgi:DNA gyrase subunit B
MNAEQLWETAMDPAQRQLLQLKIEDFAQSDYWFNLLMGEEVAPRRQFIEDKAHFVRNLDI